MPIKLIQFVAIILTALALVPGGAHLMELPNKIRLGREEYMTVQRIYRGWALAGAVLLAAIASTFALALVSRGQQLPFVLAGAAFLLLALTLIIFFVRVYPANAATRQWTGAPEDEARFERLRRQWEHGHALNAVLTLLALAASLGAALGWRG